jgi:hypothetical protein
MKKMRRKQKLHPKTVPMRTQAAILVTTLGEEGESNRNSRGDCGTTLVHLKLNLIAEKIAKNKISVWY